MISFAHAAAAPEATRRYNLGISTATDAPTVELVVKFAGESNRPYWNAMFKRLNVAQARARAAGEKFTPEQFAMTRSDNIELYAAHIIVGWEHVTDEGKVLAFTPDLALKLLTALIDPISGRPDIWTELERFCGAAANFGAAAVDAVELGKK